MTVSAGRYDQRALHMATEAELQEGLRNSPLPPKDSTNRTGQLMTSPTPDPGPVADGDSENGEQ